MNSIRVRCVKLKPEFGAGTEFPYAVQVSTDGLIWWTVARHKKGKEDDAIFQAKGLLIFAKENQAIKEEHVLWTGL